MAPWIVAASLYVIGGIGIYAVACDLNDGPIKTPWKRWLYLIWPLVVMVQCAGDLWDASKGDGPAWTRRLSKRP